MCGIEQQLTARNAISGFKACEPYSFNPSAILYHTLLNTAIQAQGCKTEKVQHHVLSNFKSITNKKKRVFFQRKNKGKYTRK